MWDEDSEVTRATPEDAATIPEVKYEYLDHPADVQIHAWGSCLREAYEQAAMGMFGYMTDLETVDIEAVQEVEAEAEDLEGLLFHFLDECLFAFSCDPFFIARKVEITEWVGGGGEEEEGGEKGKEGKGKEEEVKRSEEEKEEGKGGETRKDSTGEEGKEGQEKEGKEGQEKEGKEGQEKEGKEGQEKEGKEGQEKEGKEGQEKEGKEEEEWEEKNLEKEKSFKKIKKGEEEETGDEEERGGRGGNTDSGGTGGEGTSGAEGHGCGGGDSGSRMYKIRAKLFGEEFQLDKHPQGTEVKAITYASMQVYTKPGQHEVFVIVDI